MGCTVSVQTLPGADGRVAKRRVDFGPLSLNQKRIPKQASTEDGDLLVRASPIDPDTLNAIVSKVRTLGYILMFIMLFRNSEAKN